MKRELSLLALVGALLLSAAPVPADDGFYVVAVGGVGTKISSVPYTISTPGFYYLGKNLVDVGGGSISITSGDVTLDLMGYAISGTHNGSGITIGGLPWGLTNVEIRNGTITDFIDGIRTFNVSESCHRIINVRTYGNTTGISLTGYGHMVKGCTIYGNTTGISCSSSMLIHNVAIYNGTTLSGSANTLVENNF